jgi:predicted PurR-regulated permease PerM
MSTIKINYRLIFRICAVLFLILFAWYFPNIILYIFLAFILALIGKPLANILYKIKIFKRQIPYSVCSAIAILVLIIILALFFVIFVPVLIQEVRIIENINYDTLAQNLTPYLNNIQQLLYDNNLMDSNKTIVELLTDEIRNLVNVELFSNVIGGIVSTTSSVILGFFAVFFMGFFFIKDDFKLEKIMQLFFSDKHQVRISTLSNKINGLLSGYFIGTLIRIAIMIVLLYIGLLIFGIRGALFLAFLGGLLNIIPYLGPVIGAIIACLFGFIDCISAEMYSKILIVQLEIIGVFVVANVIDNVILQPYIYSQSVKIHPVEVFLVTIIGGDIAGIMGMIFAIPVYTIVRVIIIEIYNYVNNPQSIIYKKTD